MSDELNRSVAAWLHMTMSSPMASTARFRWPDASWNAASRLRSELRLWPSRRCSMSCTAREIRGGSSGLAVSTTAEMSSTPTMRRVNGCRIGWP